MNTKHTPGILSCPFCGSKSVHPKRVSYKYSREEYVRVNCNNCSALGPGVAIFYSKKGYGMSLQDAMNRASEEWNKRATGQSIDILREGE